MNEILTWNTIADDENILMMDVSGKLIFVGAKKELQKNVFADGIYFILTMDRKKALKVLLTK